MAWNCLQEIKALIHSMRFLSPVVALYLYRPIIRHCMEYCCHIWTGAPNYYLELLNKLQKCIFRTVCPSLPPSLEHLAHSWNVANLSFFYRYYFGRLLSELAQLVLLLYSRGRSTRYSGGLYDFSVTIPRCYKGVYINSFFSCTARLWNFLPIDCFPFTSHLSYFMSKINRHLLTLGSLLKISGMLFFLLLFLVTPCLVVAVQSCMKWIPINPFQANFPILYPLKTPENQRFSSGFRVYKMETLTQNRLK